MTDLLEVKKIKKYFPIKGGLFRKVVANLKAVDGVSFNLQKGKTLGLVGESGCGKSTLGRSVIRLHEPTSGEVFYRGSDILKSSKAEMQCYREKMQIIFQDPNASLNPRMTIQEILQEPLDVHKIGTRDERKKQVEALMDVVEMQKSALRRYPHEFSGGQRQRVGIARALSLKPDFIVADEPVSALDVSVQSAVLNLISRLQKQYHIAFLFISHDLSVIHHISDDVAVMYLGKIVEKADSESLYKNPKHPYTKALLSAIPTIDPENGKKRIYLEGDVPSPINPPKGCYFHPRCAQAMTMCRQERPVYRNVGTDKQEHFVMCHLYNE